MEDSLGCACVGPPSKQLHGALYVGRRQAILLLLLLLYCTVLHCTVLY